MTFLQSGGFRLSFEKHLPGRPLPISPGVVLPSPTFAATQVDCWAAFRNPTKLFGPTAC